ncbi:uncharacterized protein LOC142817304 [Rhipicephalus microplus]|uniref:uncharacterized protein LOC142817304 n=1 Tax=Rhipicephalus microplus TaxID=6941 RepID=UPI003F6BAACB
MRPQPLSDFWRLVEHSYGRQYSQTALESLSDGLVYTLLTVEAMHRDTTSPAIPGGVGDPEPVVPVTHADIAGAVPGVGSPGKVPLLPDIDPQGTDTRSSTDSAPVWRVSAGATVRTTRPAPGPL